MFLIALLVRIGFYFIPRTLRYDSYIMLELADNFFKTGYQLFGEPHSKFLPLYPFLIAVIHQISGGSYVLAARLLNVLISSLIPVLALWWPLKNPRTLLPGILAALLIAVSGFDLLFCSYAETAPLLAFLTLAGFLLYKQDRIFFAGLVLGLAGLTRAEGLLALGAVVLVSFRSSKKIIALLAGYLLASSPWLIWTWIRFGRPGAGTYLMELFLAQHTGLNFFSDLFKIAGPLALVLAGIGWLKLEKEDRELTGLYFLFYTALHCWWWWSSYRFSAPLTWMIFLFAGNGISYLRAQGGNRRVKLTALVFLLMLLAFGEQFLLAGIYAKKIAATNPDPILEAFQSLRDETNGKIISSKPLMAKFEYGIDSINLMEFKVGESPNQFVLKKVLNNNARWFIWSPDLREYYDYFNFLSEGNGKKIPVELDGKKYWLNYDFYLIFKKGDAFAYIYELSGQEIK